MALYQNGWQYQVVNEPNSWEIEARRGFLPRRFC